MADVNWSHGTLVTPPTPAEPPVLDDSVAALLDEAEDILNAAGPQIRSEVEAEQRRRRASAGPQGLFKRLFRRP
jgi:hypothetical protein